MDSILNKLTEIESAAVSIVQHAEAEKSILDEKYDEKRRQFDLELEAETKKQIPLRLNAKLYEALAAWAEDDFRSVNGQIEYLLTECVRQRKKNGKYVSDQIDVPPELDIK